MMSKREITSKQCDKIDLPKRDPVPGLALTNSMTEQNLSPPDLFSLLHNEDNNSACHGHRRELLGLNSDDTCE